MAEVSLQAEVRDGRGKGVARKLRAVGKVPATMYGQGTEAKALTVDARALSHALSTDAGRNVLIDLHVDGEEHLAMARELARHPVRGTILHVDFLVIDRNKPVTVDVPIHIEGESPGIKEGGVLEHHLWNLHVECRPNDVPDSIVVDISNVQLGQSIHVSDITPPAGVTVLTAGDEIVCSVVTPQAIVIEEAPAAAEGEEAAAAAEGETPKAGEAEGASE